jgi:hypothetical protein
MSKRETMWIWILVSLSYLRFISSLSLDISSHLKSVMTYLRDICKMYPLTCLSPGSHTGSSKGRSWSCLSELRGSEAVEICSCSIRQAWTRMMHVIASSTLWSIDWDKEFSGLAWRDWLRVLLNACYAGPNFLLYWLKSGGIEIFGIRVSYSELADCSRQSVNCRLGGNFCSRHSANCWLGGKFSAWTKEMKLYCESPKK